jgi:Carboxypeptidase regulatory-like domain
LIWKDRKENDRQGSQTIDNDRQDSGNLRHFPVLSVLSFRRSGPFEFRAPIPFLSMPFLKSALVSLALLIFPALTNAGTIRGRVMATHESAGRAFAVAQVTVILYRGAPGSSAFQPVSQTSTGSDGLYSFEDVPKGEYSVQIRHPKVKPDSYQRVTVSDETAVTPAGVFVIEFH